MLLLSYYFVSLNFYLALFSFFNEPPRAPTSSHSPPAPPSFRCHYARGAQSESRRPTPASPEKISGVKPRFKHSRQQKKKVSELTVKNRPNPGSDDATGWGESSLLCPRSPPAPLRLRLRFSLRRGSAAPPSAAAERLRGGGVTAPAAAAAAAAARH